MIGTAPEKPWDEYLEESDRVYGPKELGGFPSFSVRLKPGASAELKRQFEEYMTKDVERYKGSVAPDMKDPYFTWQGEIIDRAKGK